MEEECNAEPEKEQPNLNTSVEEEEENYDEEEDYDEDEEADYEEDFSEEEDEVEEDEVIVWSKEQEDVLKSALASFTLLPQTTVRKVVEELEDAEELEELKLKLNEMATMECESW